MPMTGARMRMHDPRSQASMLGLIRHKALALCVPSEALSRCGGGMVCFDSSAPRSCCYSYSILDPTLVIFPKPESSSTSNRVGPDVKNIRDSFFNVSL